MESLSGIFIRYQSHIHQFITEDVGNEDDRFSFRAIGAWGYIGCVWIWMNQRRVEGVVATA